MKLLSKFKLYIKVIQTISIIYKHIHKVLSRVRRKGAEEEQQLAEDLEIPGLIMLHLNPWKNYAPAKQVN